MALDSDVEAYLNQLSKKTYTLKKDAEAWEESPPSDPSSAVDHLSDIVSDAQDDDFPSTSGKARQRHHQKRALSYYNEIATLTDKYPDPRSRKSFPQDKLSSLEQKYLRKHVCRTVEESKLLKKSSTTVAKKVAATPQQRRRIGSDTSSVDEELASYLNQTSLSEKQPNTCVSDSKVLSYNHGDEDSLDEVLNINNLMTVDDILGQVTNDDDSSKPPSEAEKSLGVASGRNKQVVHAGESEKSKENSSDQNKNVHADQDDAINDDDDDEYNKPVGILLAQASSNVFRSSRRKSSIEFNVDNFLKLQTLQRERSDPEILSEEHITSSPESNMEESVVKTELSEEDQTVEEECTGDKTSDERKEQNLSLHSQGVSHIQSTSCPQSGSKNKSKEVESMQPKFFTQRESNVQTNASCVASGNLVPSTSHTEEQIDAGKETLKSNATRIKQKNREREKSPVRARKKSLHSVKSKHCRKYRSSVSTSDSTSSSSSDCEVCRQPQSHHHKYRHRRRRSSYDRLYVPAYHMHPQLPCCHHMCTGHSPTQVRFPTASTNSVLEGLRAVPGTVGVDQLMRQQVELTRQFLESQRAMYQAYTSTLTSHHRYTSLQAVEKYIKKKRQPPLTFKEAYSLVKEEMEASER